jgi:charged multivesicular body protein 4A/B
MEDIREQMDLANEVSDAIAQPLGVDYDEDELNKELEDLEQETLNEKLSEIDDSKQRTRNKLGLATGC